LLEYLRRDAKLRGIPLSGLIRAVLEHYVQKKEQYVGKKTGCYTPYFSMSERALERLAHVKFLQAIGRLRFIIAGSRLDIPALREKKLLEVADIIDQLSALAAKTKGVQNRLYIHDRVARFYRIWDMMAKNAEYDDIKRMLDEFEAEEIVRVGESQETSDTTQGKQSEARPVDSQPTQENKG
jgi:hypothetical protein